MKALVGSNLKFFTCKQREKQRVFWGSREIALCRQEIGFCVHQKRVRNGVFQHKFIHSISAASDSAQTNDESEEIQTMYSDKPKTVRVRFKLQKECAFGQQFLIVGDDPIVGLWDPSDGILLNWSEGHIWTAEMEIPSDKIIKYKFILKGDNGNISWQPGPDRILETWNTENTITVFEDWDNFELQNIVEEELAITDVINEEPLMNSDSSIVAEKSDILPRDQDSLIDSDLSIFDGNANGHTDNAENISEGLMEQDLSTTDKASGTTDKPSGTTVDDEGVPVLVPGLIPIMPLDEIEEEGINQVENNSFEIRIGEFEDSAEPEETSEMMMIDQKQQFYDTEQILESDLQWGRKTLQKFLANFGFQ